MGSDDWVDIVHPDLPDQTARVHRMSVPQHSKAGWRLASDPPPEEDQQPSKPSVKRRGLSHATDDPDTVPDLPEGE